MNALANNWPWLAVVVLGAFHGLNPGMGWLFAVALGLQDKRGRAVVTALGPIAFGHAIAIGLIAVPVGLLGLIISPRLLLILGGAVLLAFAAYRVATRFRHPRWVGMRVGPRDLVLWSFIMASAHGAGLMLAPAVALLAAHDVPQVALAIDHTGHFGPHSAMAPAGHLNAASLAPALLATMLHAGSMLIVMAVVAMVVYRVLGVELLRRAWINLDLIWAGALVIAGGAALGLGLWVPAGW
jgi:hypothetical protein